MAEVNEKVQNHADEDFAKLLEEYDNQKSHDEVVTGKVIAVKDNEIFVDVGRKLEGVLDVSE
ncbi:MAG: S1 RNA-binding domain-containing protein, partial [Campylobacter sp.]|nr:S1 RNA-binding domain-containing protein [Campylobacter sp.]